MMQCKSTVKAFQLFDENRNGVLTREEFRLKLGHMGLHMGDDEWTKYAGSSLPSLCTSCLVLCPSRRAHSLSCLC